MNSMRIIFVYEYFNMSKEFTRHNMLFKIVLDTIYMYSFVSPSILVGPPFG